MTYDDTHQITISHNRNLYAYCFAPNADRPEPRISLHINHNETSISIAMTPDDAENYAAAILRAVANARAFTKP